MPIIPGSIMPIGDTRDGFHPRRLSSQRGQAFACLDANKHLHSLPKQVGLVSPGVGYLEGTLKELIVNGDCGSHGLFLIIRKDALYHHKMHPRYAQRRKRKYAQVNVREPGREAFARAPRGRSLYVVLIAVALAPGFGIYRLAPIHQGYVRFK
jgi:hypothetical protein